MNKKNTWIIVVVVVVVLIVVAGVFLAGRQVAKAPEVAGTGVSTSTAGQSTSTASSSGGLSVALSTSTAPKSYVGPSFSLNYPGSWTASTTQFFALTSFGGQYQNGWMIPTGGAEIDVVTTTVHSSANEIMTTELMSATKVATSTVTVGGVTCTKASFQNTYAAGVPSQDISLYCLRGTELWKIYFSYHAGDPAAQAHIADFNSVMSSIKFLP